MRGSIRPPPLLLLATLALGAVAAAAAPPSGTWVGRFWPGPSADGSMPLPQVRWASLSAEWYRSLAHFGTLHK